MAYQSILYEVDEGVATITLDRPEARNAFTGTMGAEFSEAYRRCDADDTVGAVVVTGTPPAFCAGADLSAGGDTFRRRSEEDFSAAATDIRAWDVRKLVVGAVNGHAIGIGLTLALQCDIRSLRGRRHLRRGAGASGRDGGRLLALDPPPDRWACPAPPRSSSPVEPSTATRPRTSASAVTFPPRRPGAARGRWSWPETWRPMPRPSSVAGEQAAVVGVVGPDGRAGGGVRDRAAPLPDGPARCPRGGRVVPRAPCPSLEGFGRRRAAPRV